MHAIMGCISLLFISLMATHTPFPLSWKVWFMPLLSALRSVLTWVNVLFNLGSLAEVGAKRVLAPTNSSQWWITCLDGELLVSMVSYYCQCWIICLNGELFFTMLNNLSQWWTTCLNGELLFSMLNYLSQCWITRLNDEQLVSMVN